MSDRPDIIDFLMALSDEVKRVSPSLSSGDASCTAVNLLVEFCADEETTFGDPEHVWTKEGAVELVSAYWTEHLEAA